MTFLPGRVLGWLFIRTKSLLAPVLFHGLANTCYCLMAAAFMVRANPHLDHQIDNHLGHGQPPRISPQFLGSWAHAVLFTAIEVKFTAKCGYVNPEHFSFFYTSLVFCCAVGPDSLQSFH